MTLADKLLKRRKELKLTQGEVAKKIHVSRQAISNWELGKNYPDIEILIKISDVYKISLDALLKEDQVFVKKLQKGKYMNKIKYGLYLTTFLSLIITFIVDFAINRQLTWSLIVLLSLGVLIIPIIVFSKVTSNKFLKSALVVTLLVPLFLFLLEQVLQYTHFYNNPWFFKLGLPVSLLWLGILWLVALTYFKGSQNWFTTLITLTVLAIPGNIITRLLVNQNPNWILDGLINALGSVLVIILLLYLNKKFSKSNA